VSEFSTEWVSVRFRGRMDSEVDSRIKELEKQGWSVGVHYAGHTNGRYSTQLILKRES